MQSNLDEKDQEQVDQVAFACKQAADQGNWQLATDLWAETEYVIWDHTNFVDFYNVLKYVTFSDNTKRELYQREDEYKLARKQAVQKHLRKYPGITLLFPKAIYMMHRVLANW